MMPTAQTSGEQIITVPVLIDARRMIDEVKVVRAAYLIITSETPFLTGFVQIGAQNAVSIPILGQTGVIYRPDTLSDKFTDPEQIDVLFTTLDETANYSVELEDIWIPERWFQHRPTIARGELYRLTFDLFEACYRYREGLMIQISDLADLNPDPQKTQFSASETEVFQEWNRQQIQNAIASYPKNSAYALRWDDAKSYN